MNFVELLADENQKEPSPCEYGQIVIGHACYCHHINGPRKCPIWRHKQEWNIINCELFKPPQEKNE